MHIVRLKGDATKSPMSATARPECVIDTMILTDAMEFSNDVGGAFDKALIKTRRLGR